MRLKAIARVLGFCFAVLALVGSGFWPVMAPVESAREAAGVAARADKPPRPASVACAPEIDRAQTAMVQQGDSLWKLSHRILGKGLHYKEIYSANSARIRDAHKIYPGQIFVMPKEHGP